VFVRTVIVWHITWSINSVTHLWGYRNYETDESSRNNLIIGILSSGEGLAQQSSCRTAVGAFTVIDGGNWM